MSIEYFDYSIDTATASAFVQQRNKISSAALPFLFRKFTDSADTLKTYRGYRLLAADGSTIFAIFTTILETILYIVDFLIERRGFLWLLIRTLIYIFLFYFAYLSQITLAVNSRTNEYKADQFAYDVGFGDDLVSALYMLQKINISNKTTFLNKLRESHPHIAKRIGKLETMLESEETEQE